MQSKNVTFDMSMYTLSPETHTKIVCVTMNTLSDDIAIEIHTKKM